LAKSLPQKLRCLQLYLLVAVVVVAVVVVVVGVVGVSSFVVVALA